MCQLIAAMLVLCIATMAQATGRVALLIGNADYASPGMSLRNPVNDVRALDAALSDLGFSVTSVTDQDAAGMEAALSDFAQAARGAEMAVFFYAGHGVQIGDENHLIGTRFAGNDLAALRQSSVTMGRVRDMMTRAAPQIGIMLLDACRNNPFSDQGLVAPGLVRARGGAGLLIAYATDPGNVAYDGVGNNSVFTTGLLDHIATPGLDARLMLGRVRQQVVLETKGRQVPWVEESVLSEHAFAPAQPDPAPDDATTAELADWRSIAASRDAADFRTFLSAHPNGLFASFAQDRLLQLDNTRPLPKRHENTTALLASADPAKLAAALTSLGYLEPSQTRTLSNELPPALEGYRRQLPDPSALSDAQLYNDAARVSMFLAATTLQSLRTDLVALRSVERTLTIAEDALAQIEDIAATNSDALPVLRQAHSDVYDIHRSRGVILRRLDQSRSYYDDVLTRAVVFFPQEASVALLGGEKQSRALNQSNAQLTENANLFLRHVTQADDKRKGSYQWMADLIPPG